MSTESASVEREELAAASISVPEFSSVRKGGYDTVEVDEFVARLVAHANNLESARAAAVAELERIRPDYDRLRADEETLAKVMLNAQSHADAIIADAEEQASQTLESARTEADALVANARADADAVSAEAARAREEEAAKLDTLRLAIRDARESLAALAAAASDDISEAAEVLPAPELAVDAFEDVPAVADEPFDSPVTQSWGSTASEDADFGDPVTDEAVSYEESASEVVVSDEATDDESDDAAGSDATDPSDGDAEESHGRSWWSR